MALPVAMEKGTVSSLGCAGNRTYTGLPEDELYVAVPGGFVYLTAVLDAWSRKVVGYAISRSMDARIAVAALKAAILSREPAKGCIHHSDRGSQYASEVYRALLTVHGLVGSMSRRGNPCDNAKAESFMKTLKAEEVNAKTYATLEDARRQIGAFIETVYNVDRLHSALGYKPPAQFEADLARSRKPQLKVEAAVSPN